MLCPHLKTQCFVPLFRATVILNYLRYEKNKYLIIFYFFADVDVYLMGACARSG